MTEHTKVTTKPKPRGRPDKYDWDSIRREYIRGSDEVTYQSLSVGNDRPSHDRIKARAAAENWAGLRAEFQHIIQAKNRQMEREAIEIVKARHAEIGKTLQRFGLDALQRIDPATITLHGAIRAAAAGCEIERRSYDLHEYTVNLNDLHTPEDLKRLTKEQKLEVLQRMRAARSPKIVN